MRPVFIVGCQRSGSTMLGAMLGAHPGIVCIPEAQFVVDLMPRGGPATTINPADIIDAVAKHWRFRIWEFDLGDGRPTAGEAPSFRGAIEWLAREYAKSLGRQSAKIWVDQQPGHANHLWKLLQHFPNAKIIHIVRDGRAVAASIMPLDWGPNDIYGAARYWQQQLTYGYAAGAVFGPERVLHVRYEDVVEGPEPTMRRIADHVDVDFAASMLTTTGLKLPRFTRHQHQLIGAPLRADRVASWSRILSRREIEIFESVVGDLLPLLGYRPVFGDMPRPPTLPEKTRFRLHNEIRKAVNALRFRLRQIPYR